MKTLDHANELAAVAVEILFSEGDPFKGKVDPIRLQEEIRQATLRKLVVEDEDILDESEFSACIKAATIEQEELLILN